MIPQARQNGHRPRSAIYAPQNLDAERAVLGAILLDREAIIPIAAWLRVEHFHDAAHQAIYAAMLACWNHQPPIPPDTATVADALRKQDALEAIGGLSYLIDLTNATPTAYHVEYYARIVEAAAVRRRMIDTARQIARLAATETDELPDTLAAADRLWSEVMDRRALRTATPLAEVCTSYYEYLQLVEAHGEQVIGIPTGLLDYDRLSGGLHRSDLIVLAARPGVGKSALALSMCYRIAARHVPIGFFSLEMGKDQLLQRLLAMHTGIDSQRLRTGRIATDEWQRLGDALGELERLPLYLDDTPGLSIADVRSRARRMVAEHGVRLLVVDYLQLLSGSTKRDTTRAQEVGEISRTLKQIARELNIPILALAQLNRQVEGRSSHVPVLADLAESGSIEQDADVVLFIYRDEMYDKDTDKKGIAEVHFAKHRNGPLGVVSLFYDQRTTRFGDLTPYYAAESPEGY